MKAARLIHYDALERRRRGSTLTWWAAGLAGLLVAGALFGLARATSAVEARGWWLAGLIAAAGAVVLAGPWRLYWRRDATFLARLPIPGRALYRLSAWRGARMAAFVAAVGALAAAALGPAAGPRHAGLAVWAAACGALAAPALTTAAGAIAASPAAHRFLRQLSGETGGPTVMWLGLLPALGALGVGWAAWRLAPWARGGPLDAGVLLGAPAVAGALYLGGEQLAAATLSQTTRAIAALDAVKLAHVDLSRARAGEAAWGRIAAPPPAQLIYAKDIALLRRRYPGHYLLTGALILAAWAAAALSAPRALVGIGAALVVQVVILARRQWTPPTEHPRVLATLPFPAGAPRRAKRAYLVWRAAWPLLLAAGPAVARAIV